MALALMQKFVVGCTDLGVAVASVPFLFSTVVVFWLSQKNIYKKNQYLLAQEGSSNYRQIIVVGRPVTLNLKIATQLFLHNILVLMMLQMYHYIKLGNITNNQFSTSECIICTNY